jgi:hypothetical protein
MHGGRITESIERLNNVVLLALLIAVGIRLVKKNIATISLTVVADVILMGLTVETIIADSLWDTLKNFVVEPAITLTIVCIVLLARDWVKRIKKLKIQVANQV